MKISEALATAAAFVLTTSAGTRLFSLPRDNPNLLGYFAVVKIGERLKVKIEGIGSRGEGLARAEGHEIFIPKVAPFDEWEVEILEEKKGRFRAKPLELLTPSPKRVSPACRHFSECGGCDFQHLAYEDQLAWKERMTKHWIRRSPLAPQLPKIMLDSLATPSPYNYRHRVRLQIKDSKLHYFRPHSNDLLEIKECPILVEGFFESLQKAAARIDQFKDWNQSFIDGELVATHGSYEIEDMHLSFDSQCFTQGNLAMNELIWQRIREDVESLQNRGQALDLFCGIGNFSLPLSKFFDRVSGVESEGISLNWARKNAERNERRNIEWFAGLAEDRIEEFLKARKFFDLVVLDPPRLGSLKTAEILSQLLPPKIIYVSCQLDTLVRDLTCLVKKGRYRIDRWTTADMFPQTHHIESIVSLSLQF